MSRTYRLRYDGSRYPVPASLKVLDTPWEAPPAPRFEASRPPGYNSSM